MLSGLLVAGMAPWVYTLYWVVCIICFVLIFIAAVLAILAILFQKSNSDGIQGITASSETFFGKNKGRSIESKLKKWSWILLGIIGGLSLVMYIIQVIAPTA